MPKILARLSASFLLVVSLAVTCTAQESNQEIYDRALPQFTRLLGSETAAKSFLDRLNTLSAATDRPFFTLVKLTQRSLVAGVPSDFSIAAAYFCAEAAEALSSSDTEYAFIVLTIYDMKLKNVTAYGGLESLINVGIPAYNLLGFAIGEKPETTKRLAWQDKLKVDAVASAMLRMFQKEYGGSIKARSK